MEHISRGPTFGDFVTIRTEGSTQDVSVARLQSLRVLTKGVGPGPTLAWPGWKQPDIPVEVDTDRLETSRSEAGVLKKLS
jgi:hypothetical protein